MFAMQLAGESLIHNNDRTLSGVTRRRLLEERDDVGSPRHSR
jgi:hypothetical protein